MSDWSPEYCCREESLFEDHKELTRRAAAIRKRDERIAALEKALYDIARCDAPSIARSALAEGDPP